MQSPIEHYVPALSYDWLTPFYDSVIRWTMPELRIKRQLIQQAQIKKDFRVLDLGCGTATLTLLVKKTNLDAHVIGIDGDAKILTIARSKANEEGLDVTFDQGMAFSLPYGVLRSGGELHIADFGKPQSVLMTLASIPWRLFDGKTTADNVKGFLPELMRHAGFVEVRESARYMTVFGTVSLYASRKPQ
jgi:SAM-dependent methyltransferase